MEISMRQMIKALVILSSVIPFPSACRPHGANPMPKKLDALLESYISGQEPGAAVLIVKDGRAVYERGFGVTDLRTMRRIGSRTNFRLASVTKAFTAAAVMLLVRDGKLR